MDSMIALTKRGLSADAFRESSVCERNSPAVVFDVVLQKQVLWFFILTAVVDITDPKIASRAFGEEKYSKLLAYTATAWYFIVRLCCGCTVFWGCLRFSYYLTHYDGYALFEYSVTALCIIAQSCCVLPMAWLINRRLEGSILVAAEAIMFRQHLPQAVCFLLFSLIVSTCYPLSRLLRHECCGFIQNELYIFLLLGQIGTSLLLAPVLLFQKVNIDSTELLVNNIYNNASMDRLTVSEYMKIERTIRDRTEKDFWTEFAFFFTNLLNSVAILVSLFDATDGDSFIQSCFFIMIFLKEAVVTIVVMYGAARVNDIVDRSIVVLTDILLLKTSRVQEKKERQSVALMPRNPLMKSKTVEKNSSDDFAIGFKGKFDRFVDPEAYGSNNDDEEDSLTSISLCIAGGNRPISYSVIGLRLTMGGITAGFTSFAVSLVLIFVKIFVLSRV